MKIEGPKRGLSLNLCFRTFKFTSWRTFISTLTWAIKCECTRISQNLWSSCIYRKPRWYSAYTVFPYEIGSFKYVGGFEFCERVLERIATCIICYIIIFQNCMWLQLPLIEQIKNGLIVFLVLQISQLCIFVLQVWIEPIES